MTMTKLMRTLGDERGAMLVHVALAMLVVIAFSTFVADYGLLWTARRQAQNSADAGALGGAVASAYNDGTDLTADGDVVQSAFLATQKNLVWGQAPSVVAATDITFPTCPDGSTATCIRVDVYRNADRGNALPVFFGMFIGLNAQDVQATATAEVQAANSSDCLKPWGVIDKWVEHWDGKTKKPLDAPWTTSSTFDKYDNKGVLDPAITTPDVFIAPTTTDPGSGFHPYNTDGSYTTDYGLELQLKLGSKTDFNYASGWFANLNLFDSKGGNDYRYNIKHCIGTTYTIGDSLPIDTKPGQTIGPTEQAVNSDADSIVNQDPGATWDSSMNGGRGGVTGSKYAISPRIVAVPLVNPEKMIEANKNGLASVPISNIMGFFVEGYDKSTKAVLGRLMTMPGMFKAGAGAGASNPGTFLKTVVLVR
jgi:Flp pilus assembly protein TadG